MTDAWRIEQIAQEVHSVMKHTFGDAPSDLHNASQEAQCGTQAIARFIFQREATLQQVAEAAREVLEAEVELETTPDRAEKAMQSLRTALEALPKDMHSDGGQHDRP